MSGNKSSGRNREPTALKLVKGNFDKRFQNKNEPKPRPIVPRQPRWMLPSAKRTWKKLTPILTRMKVLTEADEISLSILCQIHGRCRELEKEITKQGYTTFNMRDGTKPIPEMAMLREFYKLLRSWMIEFGLTPTSRSKMVAPNDFDDPMKDYIR